MSKKAQEENSPDHDDDDGLSALSALVRPSAAPARAEEADDGKLDLRALAASIPPAPEPSSEPEPAPAPEVKTTTAVAPPAKKKKKKSATPAIEAAKPAPVPTMPVAEPQRGSNTGIWVGIGIAVVAAAAVYLYINNGSALGSTSALAGAPSQVQAVETGEPAHPTQAEPAVEQPAQAQVEAPAVEEPPALEAPVEPPSEPVAEQGPGSEPVAAPAERHRPAPVPAHPHEQAPQQQQAAAQEHPAQPAPQEAHPAPEPPHEAHPPATGPARQGGAVDTLLDQALGGRPNREGTQTTPTPQAERPAPRAAANNANLPDTPGRQDISRALGGLMPRIRQCAGDQVGMAVATILVRNDGTVASASVMGQPFQGTPQGACMEGALRGASFPPFRQTTFQVRYPFSIRAEP